MKRLMNGSMLLALFFAAVGGTAAYFALAGNLVEAAPDRAPVVVFTGNVAVGTRVAESDVEVRQFGDTGALADQVATSLDQVVGKFALFPIVKGEPALLAKISDQPPGSTLAAMIPADRVAISVAVSNVIRAGGFVAPGDRVDVYAVITKDAGDSADLVLTDIPVLAVSSAVVGDEAKSQENGGRDANPRSLDTTVTLVVTADEARRLVQVDELGKLRLALRPRVATQ